MHSAVLVENIWTPQWQARCSMIIVAGKYRDHIVSVSLLYASGPHVVMVAIGGAAGAQASQARKNCAACLLWHCVGVACQITSIGSQRCLAVLAPTRFPCLLVRTFFLCAGTAFAVCKCRCCGTSWYMTMPMYKEAALLSHHTIKAPTEAFTLLKHFCVERTRHT